MLQKRQGVRECMPNFSWLHSSLCRVGVLVCFSNFFFPLVSFHGDWVKNILRFLSCLFTTWRPAKCSVRHKKVFVVVFFPSGKQAHWSQTREKPSGIESQGKGVNGSVAEEQIFWLLCWIWQYLLIGFHTKLWQPHIGHKAWAVELQKCLQNDEIL